MMMYLDDHDVYVHSETIIIILFRCFPTFHFDHNTSLIQFGKSNLPL